MNSTQQLTAIASNSSNNQVNGTKTSSGFNTKKSQKRLRLQASSDSLESNRKLRTSKEVRPQMKPVVQQQVEDISLILQTWVDRLLAVGRQLGQAKRTLGKGKHRIEYDMILLGIRLTKLRANKLISLSEIFGGFDPKALQSLSEATLFKLCAPRYREVVDKMCGRADLTESLIKEWMLEVAPKPKPKPSSDPTSGWKRMPSGGGRYYQMAHDEETGRDLDQMAKKENLLPQQVNKKAIAEYKQRHHQSAEDYRNIQLDSAALESALTWEDVERAVNSESKRFSRAVKDWTDEKKAGLTAMLAAYLVDNPEKLASLVWLPTSLIIKALLRSLLSNLELTNRRIIA